MEKNILAILSHPDDVELMCAGTLSLLKQEGYRIHIATMTAGDQGTAELSSEEIILIRKEEAKRSARILDASYHCLGFEDVYIFYDRDSINRTISLIRQVRPVIVFTSSNEDYMIDHEMTSLIVQTACFASGMRNIKVSEESYRHIPALYYCDAMEGKNKLGHPVKPSMYVDISSEIAIKEQMLACHASQREWLLKHHKIDEYILAMKRFATERGKDIGCEYAEAFRQHLGHGYPQENILKEILGDRVKLK
jgi:LmbE family N-acetylglucosaminyl deacetylase